MRKISSLFLFVLLNAFGGVQAETTLSFRAFLEIVQKYHPVVKQAELLPESAKAELLGNRSGFEPKFESNFNHKVFTGTEYYQVFGNALKIPTWLGPQLKAGYDDASGKYLNPERTVPTQGLSYVGIEIPVLRGLIVDERRLAVRQGQFMVDISEADKVKWINKILYEASKDYWEWYFKSNRVKYLTKGYELAKERYAFVNSKVLIGEEAAIDSIEAGILLQNRLVSLRTAEMELQNAKLILSVHLWGPKVQPYELSDSTQPELFDKTNLQITDPTYALLKESMLNSHPDLLKLGLKVKYVHLDKKLATWNLLPTLNLNYNHLTGGFSGPQDFSNPYLNNNYKWGFDVSIPLLMRKERSKYLLSKIKIKQVDLDQKYTRLSLQNDLQAYYNEWLTTSSLLEQQIKLVKNYGILRDGEVNKFFNGESSLFLVNAREAGLIEAQVKLAEMEAKYSKSGMAVHYAAGKAYLMNE